MSPLDHFSQLLSISCSLYECRFSSFMCQHLCVFCMCKYGQCKYICWFHRRLCVYEHYINAHINVLCVHGCFFSSFTSTCVLVCIIHTDYESSAVYQATEAVSLDCIDLVPLHAVMKNEKWTAWPECEVIGLHLVSRGLPRRRGEDDGGNLGSLGWNSHELYSVPGSVFLCKSSGGIWMLENV